MKRLLSIIVLFFFLNILGLGVLWFEYSTIMAKQSEELDLRKQIASEKQKGTDFTTTAKIVTQAQKESGALSKYFYNPGEESQINFIAQMENLGTSTGVMVETRSLDLTGGVNPSLHGEFTIKGTWKAVYRYLRLMETFPAHLIVGRFTISAIDKKNSGAGQWSGGLTVDLVSLNHP